MQVTKTEEETKKQTSAAPGSPQRNQSEVFLSLSLDSYLSLVFLSPHESIFLYFHALPPMLSFLCSHRTDKHTFYSAFKNGNK